MLTRWFRFNAVGMAGVAAQLGMLWVCTRFLGMQYVAATAVAVEVALLHNFAWHEAWTWRGMPAAGRWRRLARFHLANGLVSIVSNTLLTFLFKQNLGLPLPLSNLLAIAGTALSNFALANAFVFREAEEGR
jgi:putative flippase GtrA